MTLIRLTKKFTFEMAHALLDYNGACSNIHGHSYCLYVTIIGMPLHDKQSPKNGMVIDYSILKKIVLDAIVQQLDHSLLLNADTSEKHIQHMKGMYENIVLVPYQPTCENLLIDFAERIKKLLPSNIHLHSIKLNETSTSFAEWFADDNVME